MGIYTRAIISSPRRWLPIAAGMIAIASLAGCGTARPEAGGLQPTASAAGTGGPMESLPAATASIPSSPAVGTKPATSHPSPTSSTRSGSAGGGSSGSGSGSGSGRAACVTAALRANCGPFSDPQIQGTSSGPTVSNDVWNPISGWQQTLYANNPGNWYTVATGPSGNTAVVSYPSSGSNYNERALSSFPALYSSFSENMHPQSGTSAEAAYDVWLNNWKNEIMIQHDMVNRGSCPTLATTSFGGSGGVPVQTWKLCQYGSELIWQLSGAGEQSGSVDILGMLKWLVSHNYLPKSNGLTAIGYGFEICSTGGRPETFTVSGYSVTT